MSNTKSKPVKKGFESSNSNFIALGSRKNADSATNAANALDSVFSSGSTTLKFQTTTANQQAEPQTGAKNGSSKPLNSQSSSNFNASSSTYLDPKTVKDEVIKVLKEETTEKVIKLIKLIIMNLKSPIIPNNTQVGLKTQQQQQQQPSQQQPDLNYLMALSYVAISKPQLFLKNPSLVDFLCTNLLFTSKIAQEKLVPPSMKSKLIRPGGVSPQLSTFNVQPTICNILFSIYETENCWPEIFIKAYFDDSLGERTWVDNPSCKEFVLNLMTAFGTKPIPFSADSNNTTSTSLSGGSTNDQISAELAQCEQISLSLIENSSRRSGDGSQNIQPRYSSIRNEIEVHLVDLIRSQLNSKHQQASQRILGQTNIMQSAASMIDNRNFLKLLQNTCGFCEVRGVALSKLEGWLVNPKLTSNALDLLLSICVNCNQGDQADRDLIAQIIRFKPKIKQQQHYFDCIRELIKQDTSNFETLMQLTVLNELTLQQQYLMQHQSQQHQQLAPPRNQHNLNLLQNAFATDSVLASKTFAQIMLKILLQRNSDDYLRLLRSLLRDTIRNSRHDFDLLRFTNELLNDSLIKQSYTPADQHQPPNFLINLAGGLADFNQIQIRERFANGVCDLITVCILVAITPTIKEAYLRRTHDTKDILIKYYLCMAQIQADTTTWLQTAVVSIYKISPTELIRCMFKVLFMVDKPEQCYTIDSWPSEQERGTMFRVVSEIPVLSETLHQVLLITKSIPDHMFMLMLCVEENLLKISALVHNRDIYSLKLTQMDTYIQTLFSICQYTYQTPPNVPLAITALYWRAWQILLILTALDPKGFGLLAWEKYPTLRLLMEMVMTEDYNYPPLSSVTDEMNLEQFRAFETQACFFEKQDILEFENGFELKQGSRVVRTEANSKLIGQVMKFDPTGTPRRPTIETIQNIRKLNSEYKLGQLLCKSREPDFLLKLINRQSSTLSLPWLSTLIESSSDCLEIMPIQCICEFVWNYLVNSVEEIPLKKQINIEQLIQRLKLILIADKPKDSHTLQQINDTFDYFLSKLGSDKVATRNGALKILYKLFISTNSSSHILVSQTGNNSLQQPIDINQLINVIKDLSTFTIHIQPLIIKYFRKAIMVETNPNYLNSYLTFIFEQTLNDYQQHCDLESSLKMELDDQDNGEKSPIILTNKTVFKNSFNEVAVDLGQFFFQRPFCYNSIRKAIGIEKTLKLVGCFARFCRVVLSLNEFDINQEIKDDKKSSSFEGMNMRALLKARPPFAREHLEKNSYLLIKTTDKPELYMYIHEKIFNLVLYMTLLVIEALVDTGVSTPEFQQTNDIEELFKDFYVKKKLIFKDDHCTTSYLNCQFHTALNAHVIDKILRSTSLDSRVLLDEDLRSHTDLATDLRVNVDKSSIQTLIVFVLIRDLTASISNDKTQASFGDLFELLLNKFGISKQAEYHILKQIETFVQELANRMPDWIRGVCDKYKLSLKCIIHIVESQTKKFITPADDWVTRLSEVLTKLDSAATEDELMQVDETSPLDSAFSFIFNTKNYTNACSEGTNNTVFKDLTHQNEFSLTCLNNIQVQIDNIKARRVVEKEPETNNTEMVYEELSHGSADDLLMTPAVAQENLDRLVKNANHHSFEDDLNKVLKKLETKNERIQVLANTILNAENQQQKEIESFINLADYSDSSNTYLDREFENTNRSFINTMLDYFCRLDEQIIDKELSTEHRLLFEMRDARNYSKTTATQLFLLSLFIHQANWEKLSDCVEFLFNEKTNKRLLNPTIVLDFFSSLLYIPELWKGTETVSLQSTDCCILNLNELQICQLLNFVTKEMCLISEISLKENNNQPSGQEKNLNVIVNNLDHYSILKFKLTKRVQLLTHFMKNPNFEKTSIIQAIIRQLETQRDLVFMDACFTRQDLVLDISLKQKLFTKIQNLLLYNIYLEENCIINFISNSDRLFSDYYSKIDIPTSLDVKAHNLLNCFGEIEVNYSQNATSSGTIGVSAIALTYKKKEKEEVVLFAKKQEAFMMDANLLCIKLASTHPFIFIRQIPMMEGLLQGRVVYSFDEFKRRKLDKLFHYIIDLLTILVPYVFHYEYLKYIESIVSHYFDAFKSYCTENRDANGSLVQKFFDFFEKFINTDIEVIYSRIIKKHSSFISYMYKLYPDIGSLKFINGTLSIPFDRIKKNSSETNNNNIDTNVYSSFLSVNIFNQKSNVSTWSVKQLEPFANKLTNRNSYDGIFTVLQELDTVSQRQPKILSYFVFYLQPMMQDLNDNLRDTSISLIMRYLRQNPKETAYFYESFVECLTSSNSRIYSSALKIFADFNILYSEKSNSLLKYALKGAIKHNIDISKTLTDAIRLLSLEKYVY